MFVISGAGKGAPIAEPNEAWVNVGFASATPAQAESGTCGYFFGILRVNKPNAFVVISLNLAVSPV
jgi:hypothetical protein